MPILNPEHLLEQAAKLVVAPPAGPPRQVDLRRSVSAAYYAIFHGLCAAAADDLVGKTERASKRYALVYRALDHRSLRDACRDLSKTVPPRRYAPYLPSAGFGVSLRRFAERVVTLQDDRHRADYDPLARYRTEDAKLRVEQARIAISDLVGAGQEERRAFLTLLVFPPRGG